MFYFVHQVMSRAISLYADRVSFSLALLQDLEKEPKNLDEPLDPELQADENLPNEGTGDTISNAPEGWCAEEPSAVCYFINQRVLTVALPFKAIL